MKFSALAISVSALALLGVGPALADAMSPPVTMQPIPNPPEKAKHAKHVKHHKAAPAADAAKK